jgi:arylsulfatase A-like enzyme
LLAGDRKNLRPVSVLAESYVTLAEILQSKGFATAAFIDGAYTGPVFGLGQGFDRVVEDELYGVRLNTEALLQWLADSRPERFLAYLHAVEVHSPYGEPGVPREMRGRTDPETRRVLAVLEEERQRLRQIDFDPDYGGSVDGGIATLRRLRGQGHVERRDLEHLLALYDRGIAYTDFWIGGLIAGLKKLGVYDEVVLVVTADHGEEFFDHGGLEHGDTFYDELLRIPLIIRVPGLGNGRTVDTQVSLLDVTPTLLDLLGVDHPHPLQGLSLRHAMVGGPFPDRVLFAEANQGKRRVAMRTKKLKYMHDQYQAGRPQAYDLESDPTETRNLCQNGAEKCRLFAETIQDWQAEMRAAGQRLSTPPPTAAIDERTRERLRALGYDR